MFALNFVSEANLKLLSERKKNITIRPGDVRDIFTESSIVWITFGNKYETKRKIYTGMIDRTIVKPYSDLTHQDLIHQNPDFKTVDDLIAVFEKIYECTIHEDDLCTVIHFSEVLED